MKKTKIILVAVTLLIPGAVFIACGGDDTTPAGPINKPDAYVAPDTSLTDGGGDTSPQGDAGGDVYNPCTNGVMFDNTRVPGYPNPPMAM